MTIIALFINGTYQTVLDQAVADIQGLEPGVEATRELDARRFSARGARCRFTTAEIAQAPRLMS